MTRAPASPWSQSPSATPVRCADCIHYRGRHGWCPSARKNVGSARAQRTCAHFEPPEPPRAPFARVSAALSAAGLLPVLAELRPLSGQRLGVRLRPGLPAAVESMVLDTIDQAMGSEPAGAHEPH